MEKILNYIQGHFTEPNSRKYLDNYNPAEGVVYSLVADSDRKDVNQAAHAARLAFPEWSRMPSSQRSSLLLKLGDLIDRNADALALAESIDNGKTLHQARTLDIPRAAANIRFFATAALHFDSESHLTDQTAVNYTTRTPYGVVGCISPWNLPLYLFTWKIAPALATGNTVVAKPSELAPMTAYLFCRLCDEAGIPPGVFNVVHGLGTNVGQAIIEHPEITVISFTGGTATGKLIAATAAPMFKKLSLELGGKNPNIIFEDCDFEEAISTSIQSSFANQGEICLCGSRILVARKIYDDFLSEFISRAKALRIGDPLSPSTNVGALISRQHKDKVLSYIALAKQEGGTIATGGHEVKMSGRCENGYFLEPTVIVGLDQQCRTNQEEIFGPVVTIMPFDNEEEVISFANATAYGLSATIWTTNLKRAHRVAHQIKSGIVWVNCWMLRDLRTPFGGMQGSGVGREGGNEALRFFTEVKNICIKL